MWPSQQLGSKIIIPCGRWWSTLKAIDPKALVAISPEHRSQSTSGLVPPSIGLLGQRREEKKKIPCNVSIPTKFAAAGFFVAY